MLLPLGFLGERSFPILLASGVSGDFGGPAEARSKLLVDLFWDQKRIETHTFLWRGRVAPAPVVLVCACLGAFRAEWKKWDENGHGNFWMYWWEKDISFKGWFDDCRDLMLCQCCLWLRLVDLVRATLEVHRNSPCLSCIVSKCHHRNRHIGMPMAHGWQQALFSALGSYLFDYIWVPLRMCFHAIAARTSTQICMATATPTAFLDFTTSSSPDVIWCQGCRTCHGEVFFFGPQNRTTKEMVPPFLHVPVDSDPFRIWVRWWKPPSSGASKLGRSFLSDLRRVWWTSKITGDRHAGFLFTINCTRTLSSAGQEHMSSIM